jgi:hypothetical protein
VASYEEENPSAINTERDGITVPFSISSQNHFHQSQSLQASTIKPEPVTENISSAAAEEMRIPQQPPFVKENFSHNSLNNANISRKNIQSLNILIVDGEVFSPLQIVFLLQ